MCLQFPPIGGRKRVCPKGGKQGGCACVWERGGCGESDWMTFNFPPSPMMLDFLLECFVGPTRGTGFLPIHLHREVTIGARAAGNGAVRISSCVRSRLCAGPAMARGARWAQSGLQRLSIPAPDIRRRGPTPAWPLPESHLCCCWSGLQPGTNESPPPPSRSLHIT